MKLSELEPIIELVNTNPDLYVLNVFFKHCREQVVLTGKPKPIEIAVIQDMPFIKINRGFTSIDNIVDASVIPRDGVEIDSYTPYEAI